ncbi:MAG TPA: AMP-binding protein [Burkholderiales bacterium]
MSPRFPTLVAALHAAARDKPDHGYTFLDADAPEHLSFEQLWLLARAYAHALQRRGLRHGELVLLDLPTGLDFACLHLAVLLCGAAACALPAVAGAGDGARTLHRLHDFPLPQSPAMLLTAGQCAYASWTGGDVLQVCDVAELEGIAAAYRPVQIDTGDAAIVHVARGSQGGVQCVAWTHARALANLQRMGERMRLRDAQGVVSWLPISQDMGRTGSLLFVLYWQLQGVLMPAERFLHEPASEARAIGV